MSFETALAFTLPWEGNDTLTNDKDDPGGQTKWGIAKRSHPDVDIPALTKETASLIYRKEYWEKAGCDALPDDEAMVVFDTAVNVGVARAVKFLWQARQSKPATPAVAMIDIRDDYYRKLAEAKPRMAKYLKGWLNRTAALRKAMA